MNKNDQARLAERFRRRHQAPVDPLERAGVARVSTASGLTLAAMSVVRQLAGALRAEGRFDVLASAMTRVEAQELLAARPDPRA